MFKPVRCPGGVLSRCTAAGLIWVAVLAILMSGSASAQFHGAQIQKQCTTPVRDCVDDADCADGNECTTNTCDTTLPRTTNCNIRATNADELGDSVTVTAAFDNITTAGGVVRIPNAGNLTVSAVSGSTSCTVGDPLPCTLNALGSWVQFNTQYTLTDADSALAALPDQGTVTYNDNCDDPETTNCSEDNNTVQATANTTVVDSCDSEPVDCDDGDDCTADSCDPETGCVNTPIDCDDSDACTADSCDPETGCVNAPIDCDDSDACTADSCDPETGCVNTPIDCDDDNACTADSCDPETGCVNTDISGQCDDGNACTADSCDPATGCVNTDISDQCDDGNACTADSCDPATGCVNTDISDTCDDGDVCTADSCDPATGCVNTPLPPGEAPPECFAAEICRTPGFWATHGGTEKAPKSQNITQAVICGGDEAYQQNCIDDPETYPPQGLDVCGTTITDTDLGSSMSAIEAMCVAVKGDSQHQLVRQLTAAALNCALADCTQAHQDLIADCNNTCFDDSGSLSANECIEQIDCFNNGGTWDGSSCSYPGTCSVTMVECTVETSDEDCTGLNDYCVPFETCHDRELCPDFEDDGEINGSDYCFEPPGPASSAQKCNQARKNTTFVP